MKTQQLRIKNKKGRCSPRDFSQFEQRPLGGTCISDLLKSAEVCHLIGVEALGTHVG